jgi:hypothetical protein
MEKLEILEQFKKQYGSQINPNLLSVTYCQSKHHAFLEMTFQNIFIPIKIDLQFIIGEFIKDENGNDKDILPMFDPESDIVDNAKSLVEFDSFCLINCFDNLFTEDAANEINKEHLRSMNNK